jgi:hypothetical protein
MIPFISITLFLIFLFISSIHVYWAFGGKWGSDAVLPTKEDNSTKVLIPSMLPTLIVALGTLSFGIFILKKGNLIMLDTQIGLINMDLEL